MADRGEFSPEGKWVSVDTGEVIRLLDVALNESPGGWPMPEAGIVPMPPVAFNLDFSPVDSTPTQFTAKLSVPTHLPRKTKKVLAKMRAGRTFARGDMRRFLSIAWVVKDLKPVAGQG